MQQKCSVLSAVLLVVSVVALAQSQTPGTITKFSESLTLEDSIIVQDGASIGIGAVPDPAVTLLVNNPTGAAVKGTSINATAVTGIGNRVGVYGESQVKSGFAVGLFGTAVANPDGTGVTGIGSRVGVYGEAAGTSDFAVGLAGTAVATPDGTGVNGVGNRTGVYGEARGTSGFAAGLAGTAVATPDGNGVNGIGSRNGVHGEAQGTSGLTAGLSGTAVAAPDGSGVTGIGSRTGVYGEARGTSGFAAGLAGDSVASPDGVGVNGIGNRTGVYGEARGTSGFNAGLSGTAVATPDGAGVTGIGSRNGVFGQSTSGTGVYGLSVSGTGVYGESSSGLAGFFNGNTGVAGNFNISGTLSKGGGMFKIDHPLDPANKYLSHSFVESPDMKNIYDGTVTTDARGYATVTLPRYFECLNSDFRYQLTVIGKFAQAIVSSEIENNRFTIRTSSGNVKVSWQVTGIRKDAYANRHRIKVEEEKAVADRGRYLHPEVFGQPREKAIGMGKLQEMTATRTH